MSELKIRIARQREVTVVEVKGYLTLQHGSKLHSAVKKILETGTKSMVLNLNSVTYIDCHGVGQIAACLGSVNRNGGALRIAGITPKVNLLLDISGLPTVMSFDPDVPASLARLSRLNKGRESRRQLASD